jgi:hypothetical protein
MSAPGFPPSLDKNTASTSQSPFLLTPNHQQQPKLSPESATLDIQRSIPRTKPKMPRSESFNPSPPHRPEFARASHSSYNVGGMASNVIFTAEDNGDELTTKGRKRKRLAKACSACHVSHVTMSSRVSLMTEKQAQVRRLRSLLQLRVLFERVHVPQCSRPAHSRSSNPGSINYSPKNCSRRARAYCPSQA